MEPSREFGVARFDGRQLSSRIPHVPLELEITVRHLSRCLFALDHHPRH
jgi:hypothetical protein